ncbi:hypothetical protein [Paludibaculum fermentans]|uniref:Uncharacterized protein n=1 Tax=Paludibaculum fermentans TaxID=1473598 RepID=A0A7S7NVS7_PALFE|nr:hypothetical protein [Paludibaculum fermentans]QOY90643.1 hypothetical protein IRI77_12040 [Paludibaculum fermentans]
MRVSTIVIGAGSLLALLVCCVPVEAADVPKTPAAESKTPATPVKPAATAAKPAATAPAAAVKSTAVTAKPAAVPAKAPVTPAAPVKTAAVTPKPVAPMAKPQASVPLTPAAKVADLNLWLYVHPATNMLAGMDWQKAKSSPTGRMFARQFAAQAGQLQGAGQAMALLDNVDRILISTNGQAASESGQPPVVVALEGRVDRAQLKKMMPAGTALERFKGADLLVPPTSKEPEMLAALVNDHLVLIGDRDSLGRVLEAGSGTRNVELLERATALSAQCEIWLVSAVSPSVAAGGSMPGMKQWDDVESMDFGIALQKGLGIRANLVTKNEESAKSLATMTQLIASMASQQSKDSPDLASVARSLMVKSEGTKVHIQLDVPLAQLERGMVQMRASTTGTGKRTLESFLGMQPSGQMPPGLRPAVKGLPESAAMAPMTMAVPAVPAVPQKRTIRISGMEDGPKEITYMTGGTKN